MRKFIFPVITIILIIAVVVFIVQIKNVQETNSEIKKENKELKQEIVKTKEANKVKSQNKDEQTRDLKDNVNHGDGSNTFESDAHWLTKEIYQSTDRKNLYIAIKPAISDDIRKQLFGDKIPKHNDEEPSITKRVKDFEFYGKYKNSNKYSSIVTFTLELVGPEVTEKHFVVVNIDMEKKNGKWLVTKFDEITSRNE
ncbi:hypothetical protein EV207_1256 [Scopulibacillus darangshiensis]|uniref:Uncharacterized protein n=1 Tax=Scopulibacillus darangshiensis TaxID=442528 RepID=A0A4V2SLR5_9BACL|nr:hypothetical protein [Scopulibacillus darangshiensis]TCP24446.1 hypothetical protein EV207_1256 [Scopulibacillus darangshiensis]